MLPTQADKAATYLAEHGLGTREKTKISLFLLGAKGLNVAFLSGVEMKPFRSAADEWLHSQYFRELELIGLLQRVTDWSTEPTIYAQAMSLNANLLATTMGVPAAWPIAMQSPEMVYSGLALGHGFLSEIRLTPILPADLPRDDIYVSAIERVEAEAGRMIQIQIRLLKEAPVELSRERKEQIIEDKRKAVADVYAAFLDWLCT
jgi:hypothetical protein